MSINGLTISSKRLIGPIQLDAVIDENYENNIRITKNPVELGADIADHAIIEPKKYTLRGIITDSPIDESLTPPIIDPTTSEFGSSTTEGATRHQQGYNALISLANEREPISVQTGLLLLENMLIVKISAPKDKDKANSLFVTIELEEVRITESVTVQISADQLEAGATQQQGTSNQDSGREEAQEVEDGSSEDKSFAKSILDWVLG